MLSEHIYNSTNYIIAALTLHNLYQIVYNVLAIDGRCRLNNNQFCLMRIADIRNILSLSSKCLITVYT